MEIPYMITGSQASAYYGEPRFTRDIDIVADIKKGQVEAFFASAEDVIIKKMEYYRDGGSEKHLRDITGILKISGEGVDRGYITDWANRLNLTEIWDAIQERLNGES
jgi:hypothetical protein